MTDARVMFEAEEPNDSKIFCLAIQTCDGSEITYKKMNSI